MAAAGPTSMPSSSSHPIRRDHSCFKASRFKPYGLTHDKAPVTREENLWPQVDDAWLAKSDAPKPTAKCATLEELLDVIIQSYTAAVAAGHLTEDISGQPGKRPGYASSWAAGSWAITIVGTVAAAVPAVCMGVAYFFYDTARGNSHLPSRT